MEGWRESPIEEIESRLRSRRASEETSVVKDCRCARRAYQPHRLLACSLEDMHERYSAVERGPLRYELQNGPWTGQ